MTKRHPVAAGLGRLVLILPLAMGLVVALAARAGGTSTAGTWKLASARAAAACHHEKGPFR
jgi:hypothetical protein